MAVSLDRDKVPGEKGVGLVLVRARAFKKKKSGKRISDGLRNDRPNGNSTS